MTGGQLRAAVLKHLQRSGGGPYNVVLFAEGIEMSDIVAVADMYAQSMSADGLLNIIYVAWNGS